MFRNSLVLILGVALGLVTGYFIADYYKKNYSTSESSCRSGIINEKHCALRCRMMRVWTDHVIWTRQFIVSSIAGIDDINAITQRLSQNKDDISNTIAPFYGAEATAEFAKLLKEHIDLDAELVNTTIANDTNKAQQAEQQLHKNADAIALFLSKANPNWNQKEMKDMFYEHLKLTKTTLQLRMKSDWKGDIANSDKMLTQAIMMAKTLADGITKQFPAKF